VVIAETRVRAKHNCPFYALKALRKLARGWLVAPKPEASDYPGKSSRKINSFSALDGEKVAGGRMRCLRFASRAEVRSRNKTILPFRIYLIVVSLFFREVKRDAARSESVLINTIKPHNFLSLERFSVVSFGRSLDQLPRPSALRGQMLIVKVIFIS
jgi:hypothetical protein